MIQMTLHQKRKINNSASKQKVLSISGHLSELRTRIIVVFIFLGISCVISYAYSNILITVLTYPLKQKLIFTTPSGGFDFKIQVSFLVGFLVSLPVIVFQILQYISPIFPRTFQKKITVLFILSFILAITGILIAYFIFLPGTLHFFQQFITPGLSSLIVAQEYLRFVSWYLAGFAFFFQLPIFFITINAFSRLKFKKLMQLQKYVILGSFILSAFLTPTPDFINQIVVAIPIILLYQVSIVTIVFINKTKKLQLNKMFDKNI